MPQATVSSERLDPPQACARQYRFLEFVLDPASLSVHVQGGASLHLRPKTFATLLYLVERRDRVVPKQELLQQLWADVNVEEDVLVGCVREIRRALGGEVIRTAPKVGYQFAAAVVECGPGGLAEPRARERPRRRWIRWLVAGGAAAVLLAVLLEWWIQPASGVTEVGWWRFEEPVAGRVLDASGFGNHGHIAGSVTHTRDGPLGNAFEFAGAGYIAGDGPGNGFPAEPGSFSVTTWLRIPGVAGERPTRPIFHFGMPGQEPRSSAHLFVAASGKVCFGWGYAYGIACGETSVADGRWRHVAGTYSSADRRLTVFLDGAHYATLQQQERSGLRLRAPWMIGFFQTGGEAYSGSLADVRLYRGRLSHPQIAALHDCAAPGFATLPARSHGYLIPLYRATLDRLPATPESDPEFEFSGFGKGGGEFAVSDGQCSLASLVGAALPTDLRVRADLYLPAGTEAGPFFRAHRVRPGDPIEAPGFGGIQLRMSSTGELAVYSLSQDERAIGSTLASGVSPVLVHPSEWHTLMAETAGPALRAWVDGQPVRFQIRGKLANSIPLGDVVAETAAGIGMLAPPVPAYSIRVRKIEVTAPRDQPSPPGDEQHSTATMARWSATRPL